jgi:hypothetical protein
VGGFPHSGGEFLARRQFGVLVARARSDDGGELLVVGGGEELEQLAVAVLGGGGELAGRVHRKGVSLGLLPSLELPVVEFEGVAAGGQLLLLEEPEEGSLFGGAVQPFRLRLLAQAVLLARLGWLLQFADQSAPAVALLPEEEVARQFGFIYLDEVGAGFGLTETVPVLEPKGRPVRQWMQLG